MWFFSIWSFICLLRTFLEPVIGNPSSWHAQCFSTNNISIAAVVLMLKVLDAYRGIEIKVRQAMSRIWTKTQQVMDEILIKIVSFINSGQALFRLAISVVIYYHFRFPKEPRHKSCILHFFTVPTFKIWWVGQQLGQRHRYPKQPPPFILSH